MHSRKWILTQAPWNLPEEEWLPVPMESDVPQPESKKNFKAFGHHMYGDMDNMRLVLSLGRSLAFAYMSIVFWDALFPMSDRSRHSGAHIVFCST